MENYLHEILLIQKHIRGFLTRKKLISRYFHYVEINRDKVRATPKTLYINETYSLCNFFAISQEEKLEKTAPVTENLKKEKREIKKKDQTDLIPTPLDKKSTGNYSSLKKPVQSPALVSKISIQKKIITPPETLTETLQQSKPRYIIKIEPSPQTENFELNRKILTTLLSYSIISKTAFEPEQMKPLCILTVIHKQQSNSTPSPSKSTSPKSNTKQKKISFLEDLPESKQKTPKFLKSSPKQQIPKLDFKKIPEKSNLITEDLKTSSEKSRKIEDEVEKKLKSGSSSSLNESSSDFDENPGKFIDKITEKYHLQLDSGSSSESLERRKDFKIRVVENPVSDRVESKGIETKVENRPKTQGKTVILRAEGKKHPESGKKLEKTPEKSLFPENHLNIVKKQVEDFQIIPADTFFSKRNVKQTLKEQVKSLPKKFLSQKPTNKFYPYEKKAHVLPFVSQPKTVFSSYKEFGFISDLNNRLASTKLKSSQSRLHSSKSDKNITNKKVLPKFSPYRLRVLEKQYIDYFK